jgi:hypothetical protein
MPGVRETDEWACLQYDWGTAYGFRRDLGAARSYIAQRLDDGTEIAAGNPERLRDLVRTDYLTRPVARSVAP